MATVTPTVNPDLAGDRSVIMVSWNLTTANNDGYPVEQVSFSDRTFTAVGTWGGATMSIEGSNDGATWVTLSDAAGAADATATTNKAMTVVELTRYIRPRLTTPGSGAAVTVSLVARKATPART